MICAAILFGSICGRGPKIIDTVAPITARLYYDDAPAFPDSTRRIIQDPAVWQDVWSQATSAQPAPPQRPAVDFERQLVVLVAAGRMRTGDVLRVDSAGIRDGFLRVFVRTIRECQDFPAAAYPFEIVRIPAADAPVDWVESRETAAHCQ